MNILTITGWGQKAAALDSFASKFGNVTNLPYVNYTGIEEVFSRVQGMNKHFDIIIGWSLGAQIAVRIVAANIIKPKLLVLIAPPFQYIKDKHIKSGISHIAMNAFSHTYAMFPSNTLRRFGVMVCQNDSHAMDIIATMDDVKEHHHGWVRWLDELAHFSCRTINFSGFPRTLIFHGDGDVVTNVEQGMVFNKMIENSKLAVFTNCGHAPHLHNPKFAAKEITDELNKL